MGLQRILAPANPALELDDVKRRLKVEHDDYDALLEAYIAAATAYAEGPEGLTGRALVDQTWDLYLDHFPGADRWHGFRPWLISRNPPDHVIEVPLPPLIEVLDFTYRDASDVEQDVDPATYVVDAASQPARIVLLADSQWPTARRAANAIRIRFRCGYIDTTVSPALDAVPDDIKQALFLRVLADYSPADPVAADRLRAVADAMLSAKGKQRGVA